MPWEKVQKSKGPVFSKIFKNSTLWENLYTCKKEESTAMEEENPIEANTNVSARDDAALPEQHQEQEERAEKEEEKPTAPPIAPTLIPETTKPSSTTTTTTTTKKSIAKELASHNSAKEPELKTGKRERKKTEFLSATTLLQAPSSKKGEERKKEQVGKGVKLREIENVKFAMDKMKRYVNSNNNGRQRAQMFVF